jgi:hypothetical protein
VSGRPLSHLLKAAALRVERLSPERALEEASSGRFGRAPTRRSPPASCRDAHAEPP